MTADRIEEELDAARAALASGNEGKARVCARRAAGEAIARYRMKTPAPGWPADALGLLLALRDDPSFSAGARDAAGRLTAKVSDRHAMSTDPIGDAAVIIDECARRTAGNA
jgi:hypothetical protein